MTTRAIGITLALIVVASAAGVARLRKDKGPSLPTATVTKGAYVDYLQLRGEIKPIRSITLTAPSSGADLQIVDLAKNGSIVKPGDVVVQFDTTVQQRTLEQKQSDLKTAEAQIDKAESELRRREHAAQTDLAAERSLADRARLDLKQKELVSPRDGEKLDIALANALQYVKELEAKVGAERVSATADVNSARQKRDKAVFDVKETERIIASMTMRTPAAGTINVLPNYRAAAMFAGSAPEFRPGDRAYFGAGIAELPDLTTVQMSCHIDEEDRARVQSDSPALVRVDAIPDRELKGSVAEIALMAKMEFRGWPPTRYFNVLVTLKDTDSHLRSGMSASARIELEHLPGVLIVPPNAIFQRGQATVAYVANGATFERRDVTILRRSREQVAVASGLREGERVATRDPEIEGSGK